MKKIILFLVFLLSLNIYSSEKKAPHKIKISLMDLKAESGIDPGVVSLLYELVLTEFQTYSNLSVISKADISSMVQFETEKELAGCTDSSCMAEIGGALGVDKIVMGSIGKLGSSYVVTLKLINIKKATVENRVTETIPANEDKLIPLMKFLANKLLEQYSEYKVKKNEEDFVQKNKKNDSSLRLYSWITIGSGSVLLLSGVVYHFAVVKADEDDFNSGYNVNSKTYEELNDEYKKDQTIRNTLIVTGSVAVLAGVGMYYFSKDDKKEDKKVSLSPFIYNDGFYVNASFSF